LNVICLTSKVQLYPVLNTAHVIIFFSNSKYTRKHWCKASNSPARGRL